MLTALLAACATVSGRKRADLSQAGNYPQVTLQQLIESSSIQARDTLNIEVVVIEIFKCDDTTVCNREDGITVAESAGDEQTLQIPAVEPYQFERNREYRFSIEIYYDEPTNSSELRILGYSLLQ
ncbi:MAG: hypothetical protein U5K69_12180 [Balneolaceae bacterium]|nr:hypothetical protein [Balneolaceae bacterium]